MVDEKKNWKEKLIDFLQEVVDQEQKALKKEPANRSEHLDNIQRCLKISDFCLTHDLDVHPRCSSCGMGQQNHMTHCPHHI